MIHIMRKIKSLEQKVYETQSWHKYGRLTKEKVYEIINILLERYENNKMKKLTSIDIAIAMDNKEEVLKLLENGTNINQINKIGITQLMTAIYFNIKPTQELKTLQTIIYNALPTERYNPEKIKFHIIIHKDQDYSKISELKNV